MEVPLFGTPFFNRLTSIVISPIAKGCDFKDNTYCIRQPSHQIAGNCHKIHFIIQFPLLCTLKTVKSSYICLVMSQLVFFEKNTHNRMKLIALKRAFYY